MPTCTKCHRDLPLDSFKARSGPKGHRSWCKNCESQWAKARRAEHRPELMEKACKSSKAYARRNSAKVKARREAWTSDPDTRPVYLYATYKNRCKKLGRELSITLEEFSAISRLPCHYCGWVNPKGNGMDRVDSSKGYSKDNVVPCCRPCNTMKMDASKDDFLAKVRAIYLHTQVKDAIQQILDTLPDIRV